MRSAIEHFEHRLEGITLRLEDTNADRGGVDKTCRIEARLRRGAPLIVHRTHADAYTAIDEAATRLKRSLTRHTKRIQESRRTPRSALRGAGPRIANTH